MAIKILGVTQNTPMSSNSLALAGAEKPHVHNEIIRRFTEQASPLINKLIGKNGPILAKDLSGRTDMYVGNNEFSLFVEAEHIPLVSFTGAATGSTGAANASFTLHLEPGFTYGKAGFTLKYTDSTTGAAYYFLLTSSNTPVGSPATEQTYTAKLLTSNNALTVPTISAGDKAGISHVSSSKDCGADYFTQLPTTTPTKLTYYANTMDLMQPACVDGIQTTLWFEGRNGKQGWLAEEDVQFRETVSRFFCSKGLFSSSNYNTSGLAQNTNQNGNLVGQAESFLAAVDSSCTSDFDIDTYLGNPNAYEDARAYLKGEVIRWTTEQRINCTDFDIHTSSYAISFWAEVLAPFAVKSDNTTIVKDGKSGQYETTVVNDINVFQFAGKRLRFVEEPLFSDPRLHTPAVVGGLPVLGGAPVEAYTFVITPNQTVNNKPLAGVYFRGGNGFYDSFRVKYRTGTVDPMNPNAVYMSAAIKGFEMYASATWFNVLFNPYGLYVGKAKV